MVHIHIHACMCVFMYSDIKLEKQNDVTFAVNLVKIKRTGVNICILLCIVMPGFFDSF